MREAIVVTIAGEAPLSDSDIAEFKEQLRRELKVPDHQEVYVLSASAPVQINSVRIMEERE